MKARNGGAIALLWGLLSWSLAGETLAQVQPLPNMAASDGISVYGTGELAVRPNLVEIDMTVSGKAELTGDALVKYRDAKKRLVESLEKLGLADLSTLERGVSISSGNSLTQQQQQRFVNGVPQAVGKPQIEVSSKLQVRLTNVRETPQEELIKTVGRLIDVAQDAGASIGLTPAEIQMRQRYGMYDYSGTTVQFVVADLAELREKAYEKAVADARDRAARLAKLNQVKLGPALSVQEVQVAGDADAGPKPINPFLPYAATLGLGSTSPEVSQGPRISSPTLADIPVQVKLLVRFAIQPADPATAQK
jgi:uncharacterized protein YggE